MKIRSGLVSNSSTSSWTCDVCGEVSSGMDLSLDECDMFECENGHTVCDEHIKEELKDEFDKVCDDDRYDGRYEIPARFCPLCNLDTIDPADVLNYILKAANIDKVNVEAEIRAKFSSYGDFMDHNHPSEDEEEN